jgi:hypothetical protein
MRFVNPASISTILRFLSEHESQLPIFADTTVRMIQSQRHDVAPMFRQSEQVGDAKTIRFSVERCWKAMRGLFSFPVLGLEGQLDEIEPYKTEVTVSVVFHAMAYVVVAFIVFAVVMMLSPTTMGTGLLILVVLIALLLWDVFVLWRVVETLRGN